MGVSGFFFYGTLCYGPLLEHVLAGEPYSARPAELSDYRAHWVKGQSFPMLVPETGAQTTGVLVEGLSAQAKARLCFYEAGFDYDLRDLTVSTQTGDVPAQVFFARDLPWGPEGLWDLSEWVRQWGAITLEAACEVMSYYGVETAQTVARRFPMIRSRAASRVRARAGGMPTSLRADFGAGDVEVSANCRPYSNFFTMEEETLSFRQFSGEMSDRVDRAAFVGSDAVIVLPYDPRRDRVMLIEQFRMGPHMRGDPHPWTLEAIAGRIDAGETAAQSAHREALEEAGVKIDQLLPLPPHYPSPGSSTEFFYPYLAICDLPDSAAGVGGLENEAEDIRSHVISFDHLMALIDDGEAGGGPLVLCALWLSRHREQIRASRGTAGFAPFAGPDHAQT